MVSALCSISSIEKGTFKRKTCHGHEAENSKVKSYFLGGPGWDVGEEIGYEIRLQNQI